MPNKAQSAGLVTGVVSITSLILLSTPAHAVDFNISGQVNRAIIAADNGEASDIGFVDNHASNTRFGFSGSQVINPDYTVGFEYVAGLGANQSDDYDINGNTNGFELQNRQANVFIKGAFGKLTLGKQDGAANSTSKVDYSGLTNLGGGSIVADYFGGISILADHPNADGTYASTSISSVYSNFDALSRVNAIRYDSPSFNGMTLSTSLDTGRAIEFASRYETEFGNGVKFKAAADYVDSGRKNKQMTPAGHTDSGGSFQEYGGSASLLLPSGLNFTAQYKRRQYDNTVYANGANKDHARTYFGGIGYIFGKNHVQAVYGRTDDLYSAASSAANYGVAYRYDLFESVNMYASYHLLQADDLKLAGGGAQDVNVIFAGVRVKFF